MEKLNNPIDEYIKENEIQNEGLPLWDINEENLDIKTNLNIKELLNVNSLFVTNEYLKNIGLKGVYNNFIEKILRLKISQDKGSRLEYVDTLKRYRFGEELQGYANFKTIMDTKQ